MKAVLPVAGFGTRMRPHTWSRPKPLLNVAGKPVLAHALDKLVEVGVDEVVFITGWLGDQIRDYVDGEYSFTSHYVEQKTLEGQAHALYLAREHLVGPCLIIFVDTLFDADLAQLESNSSDGVIFVKEIDDPRPFGVVVEEEGRVTRYIEKPEGFEHRKTTVGVFYVREGRQLVSAVEHLLKHDIRTKGEYYLADAFNVMIQEGAYVTSRPVFFWEDCGQPDTILQANRYLLEHGHARSGEGGRNALLVPPVHIADGVEIENAVVGPHVTLGAGVSVKDSVVRDAIIEDGTCVEGLLLEHSLLGRNVIARGCVRQLNVGDDGVLDMP